MFEYTMEHLFSYTATLKMPPETIGPVPGGWLGSMYTARAAKLKVPNCKASCVRLARTG